MHGARSVLLILFLLAGSLSPPVLAGQEARGQAPGRSGQGFYLEQNYPSPVTAETWIPFHLEESLFERSDSVVVSLRIYNVLKQVVAIPESVDQTRKGRSRLINVTFRQPGRKLAYWDGKDTAGRRLPTGVYYGELTVNDRETLRQIVVVGPRRRRSIIPGL